MHERILVRIPKIDLENASSALANSRSFHLRIFPDESTSTGMNGKTVCCEATIRNDSVAPEEVIIQGVLTKEDWKGLERGLVQQLRVGSLPFTEISKQRKYWFHRIPWKQLKRHLVGDSAQKTLEELQAEYISVKVVHR
jgi:hypothetical protein